MLRSVDLSAYFDDGFSLATLPPPDLAARTASLCLPRTSAVSGLSDSGGLCDSLSPASTALRRMGPSGTWAECPGAECPQRPRKASRGTHADLVTLLHEAVRRCYAAEDSARIRCERFRALYRGEDEGQSSELPSSSEFAYALAGIRAQRWRRGEEARRSGDAARDAARAKELPQLVEDAVRYAQQLITRGGGGGSGGSSSAAVAVQEAAAPLSLSLGLFPVDHMLYARFPPPLFRAAPFSAGVARLLRWLSTWHEPIDGANGHSYHDAWRRIAQSDSIPNHNPIALCPPADMNSAAYYDEFGNCLRSARLARKMADQRAVEAEAEAARARRRGYFSRAGEALSGRLPARRAGPEEGVSHGNSSGSDDASDASDEDVTNIAVLHGPCGVGKTAAVYLAAAVLGYRVVEMNTSVRRCPKNIDRLLAELTRSRRLSGRAGSGKAMVSIEEELKKLKSEHAVAQQSQSQSPSPSTPKGKGGGKANKGNAISAAAVAAFFKPRSVPVEVIDVDGVKEKPAEAASVKTESKVNSHGTRKRLREGTNIDTSKVTSAGVTTATTVSTTTSSSGTPVLPISNNNNNNNNNNSGGGGGGGGVDDDADGRTLLLFEDADVILADEAIRPFYAAVRDLAHRSKVPIVVTVSSGAASPSEHRTSMGAAQAAQYFGKQTPFTGMGSMPRSALVAQLLVVAAVERGLLLACSCAPSSSCNSLSCVTVKDAEAFRRISDALRVKVYSATNETHIDVRMWLNRLQCLLLCEQWPGTDELHEKYTNDCDNDGGDGEDAGADSPVSWLMPTRAAIAPEYENVERNALARSEWDARRGRALCFGSSPVASPWEWAHFHYAEEIATRGWSTSNGSSSNSSSSSGIGIIINNNNNMNMNMNTTNTYSSTTSSSSPCSVGIGSGAAAEARSSAGGANTDAPSCAVPPALSVGDGALLADDLPATLRERAERSSVDGETGVLGGGFTTRDRIERFGYWWRRTRRSDATRLFVAGRSGRAYEDIIGFGSLLQPVSTGKSV